jgi:uracil-DNA glycosylase family 4
MRENFLPARSVPATLAAMSDEFHQLLEATIEHLESLQAQGAQFVPLEAETFRALNTGAAANRTAPNVVTSVRAVTQVSSNVTVRTAATVPAAVIAGAASSVSSPEKAQAMAELHERAMQCMKCAHLTSTRQHVVFGVGSIDADLMFVGEAPGADEDTQGEPFVGAAGQLLTKMINATGLSREKVYIANILKCRPDMPAGSSGNRKPTPEEMQTCIPYLHAQIDLIQPKVLVALGGTAMEGLLGKTGITKLRGKWHSYRGIPLMPTYHPSYLLRNQSNAEKRKVWEDLMAVMEKIGLPISEKQRGFFLRA